MNILPIPERIHVMTIDIVFAQIPTGIVGKNFLGFVILPVKYESCVGGIAIGFTPVVHGNPKLAQFLKSTLGIVGAFHKQTPNGRIERRYHPLLYY